MKTLLTIIIISLFLITSCETEFDPTTGGENSLAVYCLLNLRDSVQYVRINRVFFSKDDPYNYVKNPDSVNVRPEDIEVYLERRRDGVMVSGPEYFIPTNVFIKEEGLFSSENYFVFKSSTPLEADLSYKLVVRDLKTGFETFAETDLLGRRNLAYGFKETRYFNISQYVPEVVDYSGSLLPGQFEKVIIRLLYYEYTDNDTLMQYLDWRSPYIEESSASRQDTLFQISDDLLRYYAENIPADPAIRRKAVGIDKLLVINDEELSIYIGFTGTDVSSGQYIPEYTNMDKGVGLFASRYYYTYFAMKLKPVTLDTLALGRFTKDLRFADSQGIWYP